MYMIHNNDPRGFQIIIFPLITWKMPSLKEVGDEERGEATEGQRQRDKNQKKAVQVCRDGDTYM